MRAAIILSLLGFSLCVAASADEAADKDCIDAGARRAQSVRGAVIKASRVRKTQQPIGPRPRTVEPSLTMADIVNLGDKLKAQREETARLDLTAKMTPIMVETVEKFAAMGAKPDHIVRFLQATIDEINSGKPG
jgi:hypothetical protein